MICRTKAAYSAGLPSRGGNGTCWPNEARISSDSAPSKGVSKIPGAMVTTRMPWRERSRAAGRVSPTSPPLEAEYATWPIWPSKAAIEAVLMITPRLPASSGALDAIGCEAWRSTSKVPIRFTWITRVNFFRSCGPFLPSTFSPTPMPAVLTRI